MILHYLVILCLYVGLREGVQWALINGDDWYQEWEEDPETKMLSMSVTPQKSGSLQLGVKLKKNNEMYSGCIEYIVVDNQTF